ncbi:MAG: hypothetical protein J6T34_00490 [Bacilli bacterium]|nr:hypothetical protein [Bacilli bacterium]
MNSLKATIKSDAANSKSLVTSYMTSLFSDSEFITESSGLVAMLSAYYGDLFSDAVAASNYTLTWDDWIHTNSGNGNLSWGNEMSRIGSAMDDFWNSIVAQGTETSSKFTTMLKNSSSYHFSDFEAEFGDVAGWADFSPILQATMEE